MCVFQRMLICTRLQLANPVRAVTDQEIDCTEKKGCVTREDGDWLVVSITATGPAIRIEYYDPNLKKDGDLRSYSYRWLSDYDVAILWLFFKSRSMRQQFKSSLSLQDDGVHPNDNLQYYFSNVGTVPAGKSLTFDVSYQKPTDDLSVSRLEIQPVVVDENTPGRVSLNNYLPYIIGGLGVIMIVGGFVYYRQSGRRTCLEEVPPQAAQIMKKMKAVCIAPSAGRVRAAGIVSAAPVARASVSRKNKK